MRWNLAGGLKCKYDHVKFFIEKYSPTALFISESNTRSDKDNSDLSMKNYDLGVSNFNFSKVACYLKKGGAILQSRTNNLSLK